MTETREKGKWDVLAVIGLALVAMVVIDQARFLFVYPVPDTGMWFGDETWTMLTLRELARTGIARIPEAIGSSLAQSNGLINGSIWISGLIYGFPALIFESVASPVSIGRVVTFILALVTLWVVYRLARSFGASCSASLVGIFSLVLSDAFYFSSHSARLDMATGLAVLFFFALLLIAFDRSKGLSGSTHSAFLIPFAAVLSLAVYVHVPALIALPAIFTLWKVGAFKRARILAVAAFGLVCGIAIIAGLYWLTTGSINLLGYGYNQYYNVANSLPVLHLLSWRVQKINTIDRAVQVWQVAWPIVIALAVGVAARIRVRVPLSNRERFFILNAILLIISWGLFGGPAVFYNIYVLPVAAVCAAILLMPAMTTLAFASMRRNLIIALLAILCIFAILHQERLGAIGERLTNENQRAIHALLDPISSVTNPPLLLADEPATNEVVADPNVRLMTNHLLLFGYEDLPLADILREHHVSYLLLYSTIRWHSPFRHIADSLYTLEGERTGTLTDQARTYDRPAWNEIDTLRLYKAK